jgi:hypothetical protein
LFSCIFSMEVNLDFRHSTSWWLDGRLILSIFSCAMFKMTLGHNCNRY